MARLSIVLIQLLSVVAASAVGKTTSPSSSRPPRHSTDCARVEAPTSLTWLLQDQPFEQEDPSSFFYVNQDIDAAGNKANRVAQLVTFGSSLGAEPTACELIFAMPEDAESWELIQRDGFATLRVFRAPAGTTAAKEEVDDAARLKGDLLGAVEVRPGTQAIDLGRCDGGGGFVFELAGAGRSRVAFRQASKPEDGFGVFMGSGCAARKREVPEDL